ncbi:MAG: aromatic amino acid lyase [Oligoflexales bacterium]|nr:aromatic amino acid lyase [Oligoflexales bacterium]
MKCRSISLSYRNKLSLGSLATFALNHDVVIEILDRENFKRSIDENFGFFRQAVGSGKHIYGATTGFGSSSINRFNPESCALLQNNLVEFHGCGVGDYLSEQQCAAVLFVRINSLSQGCSAVPFDLIEKLVELSNNRIIPAIPSKGSVGASGDLTPLSYLAAVLTGKRKAYHCGKIYDAKTLFEQKGISPYRLQGRDALALMNGTSVMSAVSALLLRDIRKLADEACFAASLLIELTQGMTSPFAPELHECKPHPGQMYAAERINSLLHEPAARLHRRSGFEANIFNNDQSIQDKYSLRCAPQIIGVLYDILLWSEKVVETEINGVSDNPLFLHEKELVVNGGHFYGGHIGMVCDSLKIGVAALMNLIDRQMALLLSPKVGSFLGENLVSRKELGEDFSLHHGFKAMQITLTSITAEILRDTTPMTIFSRPTESDNQDVVSMGTISAVGLSQMVENAKIGVAILLMAICQGFYLAEERGYRIFLKGNAIDRLGAVRAVFSKLAGDRCLDSEIISVKKAIFDAGEDV